MAAPVCVQPRVAWGPAGQYPRPRRLEPAERLVPIPVGKADAEGLYLTGQRNQCSEYRLFN